jgi:hypothetical protein
MNMNRTGDAGRTKPRGNGPTVLGRSAGIALLTCAAALAFCAAACASQVAPPPAAAAPPAEAFQRASGGITAPQPSPDDEVMFVEKEHKVIEPHEDQGAPATNLQPEPSAARPKH